MIVPVVIHLMKLSIAHRTFQSSVIAAIRFNQPYQILHHITHISYSFRECYKVINIVYTKTISLRDKARLHCYVLTTPKVIIVELQKKIQVMSKGTLFYFIVKHCVVKKTYWVGGLLVVYDTLYHYTNLL
jgi:hypothetical protein